MKFEVQINVENAAFYDEDDNRAPGPELARILRALADRVEESELRSGDLLRLFDVNGNRVGYYTFTEESP